MKRPNNFLSILFVPAIVLFLSVNLFAQYGNLLSKAAADQLATDPTLCWREMAELIKKEPANPAPRVEDARCIFLFATGKPVTEGLVKNLMAKGKTEAEAKIEAKKQIEKNLEAAKINLQMIYVPYSPAQNLLGSINKALGKLKQAEAAFDLAIQIDRENYRAYANRGKLRDDTGDLAGAAADYEKVVALGINDPFIVKRLPELKQKLNTMPATDATGYKIGQKVEAMDYGVWYKAEIIGIESAGYFRVRFDGATGKSDTSNTAKFLRPRTDSSDAQSYGRSSSPLWEEKFGIPEANLEAILLTVADGIYEGCETDYNSLVPPTRLETPSNRAFANIGKPIGKPNAISYNVIVGNANLTKINVRELGRNVGNYQLDKNWWDNLKIITPRGDKPNLKVSFLEITGNVGQEITFEPDNDDYVGVFRFVCTARKSNAASNNQSTNVATTETKSNAKGNDIIIGESEAVKLFKSKEGQEKYKAAQERLKNDPEARKAAEDFLKANRNPADEVFSQEFVEELRRLGITLTEEEKSKELRNIEESENKYGMKFSVAQKRQIIRDSRVMAKQYTENPDALKRDAEVLNKSKTQSSEDYAMIQLTANFQEFKKQYDAYKKDFQQADEAKRQELKDNLFNATQKAMQELLKIESNNLNFTPQQKKSIADYKDIYGKILNILKG